jgi:hypothetical protein
MAPGGVAQTHAMGARGVQLQYANRPGSRLILADRRIAGLRICRHIVHALSKKPSLSTWGRLPGPPCTPGTGCRIADLPLKLALCPVREEARSEARLELE